MYLLTTEIFPFERRLDRDLLVDRTPIVEYERPILAIPDDIKIDSIVKIPILNYNPNTNYSPSVTLGDAWEEGGYIWYRAPRAIPPPELLVENSSSINSLEINSNSLNGSSSIPARREFGKFKLTLSLTEKTLDELVIFENGDAYTRDGVLVSTRRVNSTSFEFRKRNINYVESEKQEITFTPPPVPSTKMDEGETLLGEFDFTQFGLMGNKPFNRDDLETRNGNIGNYKIPESVDKTPNYSRYFYKVDNNVFQGFPRNSNVSVARVGDVFKGYQTKREPGSSLGVIEGKQQPVPFEYDLEVRLHDLLAVIPNNILTLCMVDFTITPVLRGVSIGHVFEWEQISGDAGDVTWLSERNALTLTIRIGRLKVDRIFRFWISRGTEYEVYHDMLLLGTPTDYITSVPGHADSNMKFGNHLNTHTRRASPILLSHDLIWYKQLRVNVIRNY